MQFKLRNTKLLHGLIGALVFSGLTFPLAVWMTRYKAPGGTSFNEGLANRFSKAYSSLISGSKQKRQSQSNWMNSSGKLGNDVLYYVMVDRFADGDRGNNRPFIPDSDPPNPGQRQIEQKLSDASYDPNRRLFGLFFGGDLQGVRNRLPYLKRLGVTKIVLSPIQEGPPGFINDRSTNTYLDNGDGSRDRTGRSTLITNYHGYWLRDWFRIDPHFRRSGSDPDDFSDLRQLLNQADRMGIGVLLDLTLHQASMHYLTPGESSELDIQQFQNVFVSDSAIRRSGKTLATWSSRPHNRNDSWYEPSCLMNYQRPTASMLDTCILAPGLPTLNHRNKVVEDYLLDAAEFWLTLNPGGPQVQGYRIDAAKNLSSDFLQKLVQRVRRVNPKAILFAENFGFGSQSPQTADLIRSVGDVSIIDFDFTQSARAYFSGDRSWFGHRSNLESAANGYVVGWRPFWRMFSLLPSVFTNPASLLSPVIPSNTEAAKSWVTYLHEHDIPSLRTFRPNMTDGEYSALIAFLMTARGIPMITWGGEIGLSVPPLPRNNGLNGIGGDPFNRQMMVFPGQGGYNPMLADVTRRMAELRRRYPVLRYGNTEFLRDRYNPFVGKTILMLRKPSPTDNRVKDQTAILYGFSPGGGQFKLDLKQRLGSSGSLLGCDAINDRCETILNPSQFVFNLKAGRFQVLVLTPKKG